MSADSHGPKPRGLLCNAGAGAAAGKFALLLSSSSFNLAKSNIEMRSCFVSVSLVQELLLQHLFVL